MKQGELFLPTATRSKCQPYQPGGEKAGVICQGENVVLYDLSVSTSYGGWNFGHLLLSSDLAKKTYILPCNKDGEDFVAAGILSGTDHEDILFQYGYRLV